MGSRAKFGNLTVYRIANASHMAAFDQSEAILQVLNETLNAVAKTNETILALEKKYNSKDSNSVLLNFSLILVVFLLILAKLQRIF